MKLGQDGEMYAVHASSVGIRGGGMGKGTTASASHPKAKVEETAPANSRRKAEKERESKLPLESLDAAARSAPSTTSGKVDLPTPKRIAFDVPGAWKDPTPTQPAVAKPTAIEDGTPSKPSASLDPRTTTSSQAKKEVRKVVAGAGIAQDEPDDEDWFDGYHRERARARDRWLAEGRAAEEWVEVGREEGEEEWEMV